MSVKRFPGTRNNGASKKFFVQKQVIDRYRYLFAPDISYQDALHDIFRILDSSGPPTETNSFDGNSKLKVYTSTDSAGVKYSLKVDPRPRGDRDHVISISPPHQNWRPEGLGREEEFGIKKKLTDV